MRRGRIFFLLALIVLLGLVAVSVVYLRFLRPAAAPTSEGVSPTQAIDIVNVLVTTQKVPRGSVISRDVISLVPIQRQFFIQGMLSELKDVEGKLAKIDLEAGFILMDNMLAGSAEELSQFGSDAALLIPRGSVAIAIPIDRLTKASYPVQPGDRINLAVVHGFVDIDTDFQTKLPNASGDVLAPGAREPANYLTASAVGVEAAAGSAGRVETIPGLGQPILVLPAEPQRPRLVAQVILQDVMVLSVGTYSAGFRGEQNVGTSNVPSEAQPPAPEATPAPKPVPEYVSLIVTPQDALMITYLLANGAQFTIHLRAAGDNSRVQIEAETLQYYLNKYNVPIPVKLPYGIEPRVDSPNMPVISFAPTPTPAP